MFEIQTDDAPQAIGPYVQGRKLNNLVFTSGQLPLDELKRIPSCVELQTKLSLENALAIIKEAGLTAGDILKTTVFLDNLDDFTKVNKVYEAFFVANDAPFPARSCVEVSRLPLDAKVEIEVVAGKDQICCLKQ
ncbi:Rid family detoxifying hydrolase [Enterovibrio calviensis]|uniref:Rid family detoxifying hydrolase n=1 Tax=Enterovibrio calviensis TaxID=91359 RepID=UPI003736FFBF